MATVAINATDHFGLGANFHPSSSSASTSDERRNNKDENGNIECETMVGTKIEYSTTYTYCDAGNVSDLKTDLGAILTAWGYVLASGGATANMFVTSTTITYRDGEYPEVTMNGVTYADGTMPAATTGLVADVASVITESDFGVPTPAGVTLGTDAAMSSLTYNISCNHVMSTDGAGDFFVGNQITFTVEVDAEFVGIPTTPDITGFTFDSSSTSDSNEGHDVKTWSGHTYVDKTP